MCQLLYIVRMQADAEGTAVERTVSQRASVLLSSDNNNSNTNANTVSGGGEMQRQYSVNSNASATGDSSGSGNWRKNFYDTFGLSVTHVGMYLVTVHVSTTHCTVFYILFISWLDLQLLLECDKLHHAL